MTATMAPPLACPSWCAITEHRWDESDDLWPVRAHEATYDNDVPIVLLFVEDEIGPSGAVRGAPQVSVEIDPKIGPHLSQEQAVRLMNALSSAVT